MENKQRTKIFNLIILDKSGSMISIRNAAIAGFNETIGGIRSAQEHFADTQEHYVSLLTFCSCAREYVYECVPIANVQEMTRRDYQPCCGTPLYDAMGKGINDMLRRTEHEELCSVVITVITDGMENASHEYSGRAIKALVEQMQQEHGWNFAYIGTNQDVQRVSEELSITNFMEFRDTDEGMREAWETERKSRYRMYSRMDYDMKASENMPMEERRNFMRRSANSMKKYVMISEYGNRITPDPVRRLAPNQIFVFGSNAEGHHTGGAARYAVEHFGAVMGQGEGLQGQSYAIPTMNGMLTPHIERFIDFARQHPELTFLVTRIGCGTAGHSVEEIAREFAYAVEIENIWLPIEFWTELI